MKNTDTAADVCPREAFTRVLRAEMGVPDGPNVTAALLFAAIDNVSDGTFVTLAHQAVDNRHDTVLSLWREGSAEPFSLVVIHRNGVGVEIFPVEVARPQDDKALVLVSKDRASLFFVDDRYVLTKTPCFPSEGIEAAVERGKTKLAEAVATFEPVDDGSWETSTIG